MTVVARACALRVHSRSHLSHDGLHSSSLATRAGLHGRSIGSSHTITGTAEPLSVHIDLDLLSIIDIGKGDLYILDNRLNFNFSLLGTARSASTHKHAEQIVHASSVSTASLEALFSVLVVGFSFVLVTEDIVGVLDFLELKESKLELKFG